MPHVLTMRGAEGFLEWGHQRAARVTEWTVARNPEGLTLTGTVREADAFRLSQEPLTFRVARNTGPAWTWSVRELQLTDGSVTARLIRLE